MGVETLHIWFMHEIDRTLGGSVGGTHRQKVLVYVSIFDYACLQALLH